MTTPLEKLEDIQYRNFDRTAVPVEYRRDSDSGGVVPSILAKIGKTLFRAENEYRVTVRTELRDFIIRAEDLVLDGEQFDPAGGDTIVRDGRIYNVGAPNNEPCWRWHDRWHNRLMRVHTYYGGLDDV